MMEMGLTPGAEIEVTHRSPFGGALAVRCRGTLIAIRLSDAKAVVVKRLEYD
jgi:Fe2+ transport system protein FeoA